ncbi:MAG: hypothetical protein AB7S69_01175 [Salinivirgaceae bacterium]|jgi:hypothetical protein
MEENKKSLISKLDELIMLFERLREKATKEGIIIKNDPLYQNFELLAGNYKLIKSNIPEDVLETLGEPIQELISAMVVQLKKDLGIDDENKSATLDDEFTAIDYLLQKQDLTEEEMNRLLDLRASLKKP